MECEIPYTECHMIYASDVHIWWIIDKYLNTYTVNNGAHFVQCSDVSCVLKSRRRNNTVVAHVSYEKCHNFAHNYVLTLEIRAFPANWNYFENAYSHQGRKYLAGNKIVGKTLWCITLTRIINFSNWSQSSDVTQYHFTCTNAWYICLSRARYIFLNSTRKMNKQQRTEKRYHTINETLLFIQCGHLYDTITSDHILLRISACAQGSTKSFREREARKKTLHWKIWIWLKGIFLTTKNWMNETGFCEKIP